MSPRWDQRRGRERTHLGGEGTSRRGATSPPPSSWSMSMSMSVGWSGVEWREGEGRTNGQRDEKKGDGGEDEADGDQHGRATSTREKGNSIGIAQRKRKTTTTVDGW